MYNLKLFQVFYEGDLMFLTESFCKALSSVLNDKLSEQLILFMENAKQAIGSEDNVIANNLRQSLSLLEEHTLPRAHILTMHLKLGNMKFHDSSMYDYIRTLSLEGIKPNTLSAGEVLDIYNCLGSVIKLIPEMVDRIEARQKKDYEKFLFACEEVSQQSMNFQNSLQSSGMDNIVDFGPTPCDRCVSANKEFFYSFREAARYTGLGQIIRRQQDLYTIYSGLQFIYYCDTKGILMAERSLI